MAPTAPPNLESPPEQVARACAAHLSREVAHLETVLASLSDVRTALLRGDLGLLPELLRVQEQIAADSSSLNAARESLRQDFASLLRLPAAEATLSAVLRLLPPSLREPLSRTRQRLLLAAHRAEALRRSNASLLSYALDFSRILLGGLIGGAERYGPAGRRQESAARSLIQAVG